MKQPDLSTSILRFINGRNDSIDYLRRMHEYITDPTKTDGGTLVTTQGCSQKDPLADMIMNKRFHQKTHGKQGVHFVLSCVSNGVTKPPAELLKVTREIVGTVYSDYLAVIAVHTDTKAVHSHVVLDAVNAVTGRKFSQGPCDLNRVKQRTNGILQVHGFEIIRASANDFVDQTDYSKTAGFDFLEPSWPEILQESDLPFSTLPQPRCYYDEIGGHLTSDLASDFHRDTIAFIKRFYGRRKDMEQKCELMPVQQPDSMKPAVIEDAASPTTVCAPNSFPTTSVATGPTFRIKGDGHSDFTGLSELVAQTTASAQEHQLEAANLALAMQIKAQDSGRPTNVTVVAGPIFDIDLSDDTYTPRLCYGDDGEEYYE